MKKKKNSYILENKNKSKINEDEEKKTRKKTNKKGSKEEKEEKVDTWQN